MTNNLEYIYQMVKTLKPNNVEITRYTGYVVLHIRDDVSMIVNSDTSDPNRPYSVMISATRDPNPFGLFKSHKKEFYKHFEDALGYFILPSDLFTRFCLDYTWLTQIFDIQVESIEVKDTAATDISSFVRIWLYEAKD